MPRPIVCRAEKMVAGGGRLLRLVEAERAWAAGDFRAAIVAFDAARCEVAQQQGIRGSARAPRAALLGAIPPFLLKTASLRQPGRTTDSRGAGRAGGRGEPIAGLDRGRVRVDGLK
jgi:hypothetical protein